MLTATINLYKKAYSGLNRNIWLLAFVMLINRSGTMVLAFLTLYCMNEGFSIEQGGIVVAIYGIGSMVGAFLGGKLSDRFGFYNIQFAALFLGGCMFMLLGQMQSYLAICLCTFVLSMVNETFRPANASAIAHYSTLKNRTQSFSLVRLAINLGWGVGIAIGGFMASFDYHLLFWVDGGTSMVAAFTLLLLLPRTDGNENRIAMGNLSAHEKNASAAHRDRTFWWFLVFIVLFATCFFQLFTTVPIYFKEVLLLDEYHIGLVMSLNGILIAAVEMLIVFKLEGRKPYLLLIAAGTLLMGLSFLLLNIPFLSGMLIATIAVLVLTIAEMVSMPFMNSYYISRTKEHNRGAYAGMYTMAWSAAQVIGSSTGAILANHIGFVNLWYLVAFLCVLAAMGFYRMHQRSPRWATG